MSRAGHVGWLFEMALVGWVRAVGGTDWPVSCRRLASAILEPPGELKNGHGAMQWLVVKQAETRLEVGGETARRWDGARDMF